MARTKTNPSSSVTFRMPDSLLKEIDELAIQNSHDRTSEINGACKYWVSVGGVSGVNFSTSAKIAELEEHIVRLESSIGELSKYLGNLEKNNSTLLAVIESNEHTIKRLLETISRQQ